MPHKIFFATGNNEKFLIGRTVCQQRSVELIQKKTTVDEIQSEDSVDIIRTKANAVFQVVHEPIIVSDDSWVIPALHGFPGPYMKSVNHWFSTSDWLNLMNSYQDRTITLVQLLAYQDEREYKCFRSELEGHFLLKSRGGYGTPLHKVVSMNSDHGLSLAEVYDRDVELHQREVSKNWTSFLDWYTK